ncbi:MAG: hypothetical protein MJD61_01630 [Proteobacteria bacterium]|nr:hypothetical protein [Pseudomonadota bacterium]
MSRGFHFVFLCTMIGLVIARAKLASEPVTASVEHPDWISPETLSQAIYSIVSGPAGQARDWDRYRALFREGARFVTFGSNKDSTQIFEFGVEDYIEWYRPSMLENGIYEKQIWHRTEQYGRLAQRWGTCEYRWQSPDGPPKGRCLVSMQFVYDGKRWWITSMIWEGALKPDTVPAHYLSKQER